MLTPRIASVDAGAVTDEAALGRTTTRHDRRGETHPFDPPWGEMVCVVTADDGSFGVGMGALAAVTVPVVNEYLGPILRGEPALEVERLYDLMEAACAAHFGAVGLASYAMSAVDLALWDLRGKTLGLPVHRLISGVRGERSDPVACYATGFDAQACLDAGYEAVKLPCPWTGTGANELAMAVDRVAEARALLGDERRLMLDLWEVTSVDDAVAIGEATRPFGLDWIEEPVGPADWQGLRAVRARLPDVALAAGERWYTVQPFSAALGEQLVDIVQPDPLWVGGATPTIRIADRALGTGVGLALHCGANDAYGQHLSHGLRENLWAEMYIGTRVGDPLTLEYRSTPGMAIPVDGRLTPSDAPGFGIELTLADIDRATA